MFLISIGIVNCLTLFVSSNQFPNSNTKFMDSPAVWVRIRDIGPGNENLLLRGVIVRKQDTRMVRIKRDNTERCVWSFTLRDSPCDLINITIWGTLEFVNHLYQQFKVGDVVSVVNVKAVFRKFRDNDEFQPPVTSSFSITFNENQSRIYVDSTHADEFKTLLVIPTKPPGNFLTLNDILENGESLKKQFVNSLAAVREVQSRRQFKSKTGQNLECREVTLIDESYTTLTLTVWGADLLMMSENWVSRSTVLFLADIRVDWSDFKKAIIVSTTGRTIITENPRTTKAQHLQNFLTSIPFQATGRMDQIVSKYTDLSVINKVMSCQGVITKSKDERQTTEFSALVYALLESFPIDTGEDRFMISKCMRCHFKVDPTIEVCLNANCPSASGLEQPLIEQAYDMRVSLLDHTGLLINCKLLDGVTAKMIGYTAPLFYALPEHEKSAIKWRHLLKYFAVRIVVLPIRGKLPIISVLSLDPISINKFSSLIPMF